MVGTELITATPAARAEMVYRHFGNFESYLLAGCIKHWDLWAQFRSLICIASDKPNEWVSDFENPADNAIYYAVMSHNVQFAGKNAHAPLSLDLLTGYLNMLASKGFLVGFSEVQLIQYRFAELLQLDLGPAVPTVTMCVPHWIRTRRMRAIVSMNAELNPDLVMSQMTKLNSQLASASGKKNDYFIGENFESGPPVMVQRYPMGMHGLDAVVGGGLARGEGAYFIAAQNTGKTVHAVQTAVTLASSSKLRGILISTEEGNDRLERRIFSRVARLPYRKVKDGIDPSTFTPDEKKRFDLARQELRELPFRIVVWPKTGDLSIVNDIDAQIARYQDMFGGLDFVSLDWIGGALGSLKENDPGFLRILYQITGDKMAAVASTHNLITMSYAQARPKPREGYDNPRVGPEHLNECKTLGNNMTTGVGISGLRSQADADGTPLFEDKQFFYAFKSRTGEGGRVPFWRNYAIQQISDVAIQR
jgi:hypothetical protein